jgi:hypothetical protein
VAIPPRLLVLKAVGCAALQLADVLAALPHSLRALHLDGLPGTAPVMELPALSELLLAAHPHEHVQLVCPQLTSITLHGPLVTDAVFAGLVASATTTISSVDVCGCRRLSSVACLTAHAPLALLNISDTSVSELGRVRARCVCVYVSWSLSFELLVLAPAFGNNRSVPTHTHTHTTNNRRLIARDLTTAVDIASAFDSAATEVGASSVAAALLRALPLQHLTRLALYEVLALCA